ncbi:YqaE/Pmp3 family membrane protein [uncultured Psychroserpens sp.]|uniref:YqaE/Pmp3 family membrane protein n=1 Tax=uncultured Psychroserpens sp. TaxID=255436 RepID=UPI00260FC9BE|nr:YqaE/Pmp3 family membrane protein [uncultured Psychroserpens sp.]
MSILTIILNIFLPPLAVVLKHGLGTEFLISLLLTLIGWLPGVIYAFYVNSK